MSKLTPQELCLYYGQEFIIDGREPEILTASNILAIEAWSNKNFQLLLRPITDMTEEEAKALGIESARWAAFHYGNGTNALIKPKAFIYLLSKGFDLFGHIESGKAIDKTK